MLMSCDFLHYIFIPLYMLSTRCTVKRKDIFTQ